LKLKTKSILIIDPVGMKAGMDYYDINLADALDSIGIPTYIASNFSKSDRAHKFFDSEVLQTKAGKLKDLIKGFARAVSFAKRKEISHVLVHVFSTEMKDLVSISLVKAAGLRLIIIAHDISGFADTDAAWIKDIIFNRYADIITVHNQYSSEALKKIVARRTQKKIFTIPHGSFVNQVSATITAETARRSLGLVPNQKLMLFFGQIKKIKGLDILLQSLPLISEDIHLIIAGKPWKDEFQTYQAIIERNALQSRIKLYIRYITDSERELFFKAADILIIPYRRIYQSGVLLMGMSYQLPVLASDIDANCELIESGVNGILFKDGDPVDLADKITQYFAATDRESIAANAYALMLANHDWNNIAKKYKQIIE
jgi:D-inositol-3-phosphate glycosyltransferase